MITWLDRWNEKQAENKLLRVMVIRRFFFSLVPSTPKTKLIMNFLHCLLWLLAAVSLVLANACVLSWLWFLFTCPTPKYVWLPLTYPSGKHQHVMAVLELGRCFSWPVDCCCSKWMRAKFYFPFRQSNYWFFYVLLLPGSRFLWNFRELGAWDLCFSQIWLKFACLIWICQCDRAAGQTPWIYNHRFLGAIEFNCI